MTAPAEFLEERVLWLGHAGLWVKGGMNVYFDPFNLPEGLPKADIVFLTHSHYDHCSIDDVQKISTAQTVVVGPKECVSKFRLNQLPMAPGERRRVLGVEVAAVRAYNEKRPYHPKEKDWLGFVTEIEGVRLYHAGDTDPVEEMNGLEPDIAFLPVDGLYHFGGEGAAASAKRLKAKLAVPVHYGSICGNVSDAARFIEECDKQEIEAKTARRLPAAAPETAAPAVEAPLGP